MKEETISPAGQTYTWIFWVGLILVVMVGCFLTLTSESLPNFDGSVAFRENYWILSREDGEDLPIQLSDRRRLEPGEQIMIYSDISYTGEGDPYPSAMIACDNLEIETYLDGELVFHHTNADKVYKQIQSIGDVVFSVSLGENCAGRRLELHLQNPFKHAVNVRMPDVTFGDHETQVRGIFYGSIPSILISFSIIFAVIILVILGNSSDGAQWTYLYFAVFAIIMVQYRAMQNVFMIYMWANPFMSVICDAFSIVTCPIPLILSYRYRLRPYFQKEGMWLAAGSMIVLAVQSILHFTGSIDIVDMKLLTHIWLVTVSGILIYMGLQVKKKTKQRFVLRKLLPIVIGTGLDMTIYYVRRFSSGNTTYYFIGDFVGIGVFVSLILMIWEARQNRLKAYREKERNQILERVAYTDALTGIYNRASFTKAITKIATGKLKGESLLVVSADLNGLKQINDTLGHLAGDDLIKRAASVLKDTLSPYGDVYRTGGDEFFGLLYYLGEDRWPMLRAELEREIEKRNRGAEVPLSIAVGCAGLENFNINACIQNADRKMYEDKDKKHAEMEIKS